MPGSAPVLSAAERRGRLNPLQKLAARAAEAEALAAEAELEASKPSLTEQARAAREAADLAAIEIESQQAAALEAVIRVNAEAAEANAKTAAALDAFMSAFEAGQLLHETEQAPAYRVARGLEVTGLPAMATVEVPGRLMPKDPVKQNETINAAVALVRRLQW